MTISKSFNRANGVTYVYEVTDGHRKVIGKIDPQTGNVIPTGKRGRPPGQKNRKSSETLQPVNDDHSVSNSYKALYESAMRTIENKDAEIQSLKSRMDLMNAFDVSALKTITEAIDLFQKENGHQASS